jgi:hypothetical protein
MTRRALVAVVAFAGCGDSSGDAAIDAANNSGAPPGFPATLMIAASQGTIANTFTATIAGSGTPPALGAVSIDANLGTIALDGESGDAALYNSEPLSGYQIFGSVVVSQDRWSIAYPYCMGGSLVDVYAEAVGSGGFALLPATGSCATTTTTTTSTVALPAFAIPTPAASGDAIVSGTQIDLDHGAGQITIGGSMRPAVVFNTVDCSTMCGSPGWYELHTLIWDDANQSATFVIIYLELETPDQVQLSLRLPTLDDPFDNALLDATWTEPSARVSASAPPVHLPPPWQLGR